MSDDGPTIDHDERVARLRDAYMDASVRMMGAANKFRHLSQVAHEAQKEAMEAATEQEAAFHEWHQAAQQRLAAESVKRDLEKAALHEWHQTAQQRLAAESAKRDLEEGAQP